MLHYTQFYLSITQFKDRTLWEKWSPGPWTRLFIREFSKEKKHYQVLNSKTAFHGGERKLQLTSAMVFTSSTVIFAFFSWLLSWRTAGSWEGKAGRRERIVSHDTFPTPFSNISSPSFSQLSLLPLPTNWEITGNLWLLRGSNL